MAVAGAAFRFAAPAGDELPTSFLSASAHSDKYYLPPLPPNSPEAQGLALAGVGTDRLQLMKPFAPWDGQDISNAAVLIKVKGQCTTDHISMAGTYARTHMHSAFASQCIELSVSCGLVWRGVRRRSVAQVPR
jgi:aconitate hydratase